MPNSLNPVAAPVSVACRLPGMPDVQRALAEVLALGDADWAPHFNSGQHNGGWHASALRAAPQSPIAESPAEYAVALYRDTSLLDRCPALRELIESIPCEHKAIRLLRLVPGGEILEHSDPHINLRDGEARLHLPLQTHEDVFFHVRGHRIPMRTAEWWYADFSQPHRVVNRSPQARIHLVIDCVANAWLHAALAEADSGKPHAPEADPAWQFAQFQQHVYQHQDLQERLLAARTPKDFAQAAQQLGQSCGFGFHAAEVLSAMAAGRRTWMQQWVL